MDRSSDFGIGRKRKAEYALRDEDDDDASKNEQKPPESYIASEEELKKRRIVKVVRGSAQGESESGPKGRFSFLNPATTATVNQSQELKSSESNAVENSNKKITITTIRLNSSKPESEPKSENNILSQKEKENAQEANNDTKKEEIKEEKSVSVNTSNLLKDNEPKKTLPASEKKSSEEEKINKEKKPEDATTSTNLNIEKKFNFSDRGSISSVSPAPGIQENKTNKPFPFGNVSATTSFSSSNILNSNPFTAVPKNPFINTGSIIDRNPFAPTFKGNSFAQSGISSGVFKSNFNFNLATAPSNPNWNSDEEDNGEDINPEEEVKISGDKKDSTSLKPVETFTNPNLVKFTKIQLEELFEYNFDQKKYLSKGKGDLSIELTRTNNDQVAGVVVYRNNALKILFQSNIMKNVTNIVASNKNFKHIISIQKMFNINTSTNKPEPNAAKLVFQSENDFELFKEKFGKVLEILEKNDLSVFPPKSEGGAEIATSKTDGTASKKKEGK